MKKHLLLSISLLASLIMGDAWAEQNYVTVGTGTATTRTAPYCNYYCHGSVQLLYSASEMSGAGQITGIAFQVATPTEYATTGVEIYMGYKSSTTFSSEDDYVPLSDLSLVYSGIPTLGTAKGWEEFQLTTPFEYNGQNLVVAIGKHAKSYSSSLYYAYTTKSNTVLYRQSDSESNYGDLSSEIAYSKSSSRPNVRFSMDQPLVTVDGITYSCYKGFATPIRTTAALPNEVTIPSAVSYLGNSYSVQSIPSSVFSGNVSITSLVIPASVTTIGDGAFSGCTSLASVGLPANLSIIPTNAFSGCTSLASVTIPASVSAIEKGAFTNCSSVTSLTIEASSNALELAANQFSSFSLTTLNLGRTLNYTESGTNYGSPFANQKNLNQLIIGNKVTRVGKYMFYGCTALPSITIPASVDSLGYYAFMGCSAVTSIIIEDSSTSLTLEESGYYSQFRDFKLQTLYLGRNIEYTPGTSSYWGYAGPFSLQSNLKEITLGPSVSSISPYMFYGNSSIEKIALPASLETIGQMAFYNCSGLKTIENYSRLLSVTPGSSDNGHVAYYATMALDLESKGQEGDFLYYSFGGTKYIYDYIGQDTQISIPAGYELEEGAFRDRTDLTSVTLPSGLTKISAHLFQGCLNLKTISIPSSVTEIDNYAFCYCDSLKTIQLPNGLKRIGMGAFSRCHYLKTIDIPQTVSEIAPMAFKRCDRLTSITLPQGLKNIEIHTFMGCYNLSSVILPEGLETISDFAFYACLYLRQVTLPSTLKSIGRYAFSYNEIKSVDLPAGLTSLGEGAFKDSNLGAISIPEGITEVPDFAFSGCNLRDVNLPEGITRIGRYAFCYCPIQYLNWPSHLTTIDFQAFACSEELRIPSIPRSVTQVGDMLFYQSQTQDGQLSSIYCFSDVILPSSAFHATDVSQANLYVRPDMLEAYKSSDLASLFARILPVGDYDGDGKVSVGDLVSIIHVNSTLGDYGKKHIMLGARDINGDANIDIEDINGARNQILQISETSAPGSVVTLPSTPITEPFLPTLSDDCVLMTFDGYYQSQALASIELINQLRWEACMEGVRDPEDTSRRLSPSDYTEVQWSTDLEHTARRRAAHTVVSGFHTDMGKYNNDKWGDVSTWSECIGYYNMLFSVYAYYDEKDSWVCKLGRTTGHYTSLIEKSCYYYGLAFMQGYVSLLHYCKTIPEGADQEPLDDSLYGPAVIDVYKKYIKDHVIVSKSCSMYRNDAPHLVLGHSDQLSMRAHLEFYNGLYDRTAYVEYYGHEVKFTSKTPNIATITSDGFITANHVGEAQIEAELDGVVVATVSIPVTCSHSFVVSEPDSEGNATGVCSQCGETIEGAVPTYFYLWWTNATLNPMSHSGGVPSNNPVGSQIECHSRECDGDANFRQICVEYLTPDLIEGPSEFLLSDTYVYFKVIGKGTGKIRMYLKYNPSYTRTFTFNLTEPSADSEAPRRGASRTEEGIMIPTFDLPGIVEREEDCDR